MISTLVQEERVQWVVGTVMQGEAGVVGMVMQGEEGVVGKVMQGEAGVVGTVMQGEARETKEGRPCQWKE